MRAHVVVDERQQRIHQVWITGDFFVHPARAIPDLEASFRDVHFDQIRKTVEAFFQQTSVEMLLLTPEDFIILLEHAVAGQESVSA